MITFVALFQQKNSHLINISHRKLVFDVLVWSKQTLLYFKIHCILPFYLKLTLFHKSPALFLSTVKVLKMQKGLKKKKKHVNQREVRRSLQVFNPVKKLIDPDLL